MELCKNQLKKLNYDLDILHCHFGQIGLIGSFLKDVNICKKLMISFYGGDLTSYVKTYGARGYKHMFNTADKLIPCTKFLERRLINLGADPKKIKLIYLSKEGKFFVPSFKKKSEDKIILLTIARLVKEKGIQNSIKAIRILSKKYPYIEYRIIGDGQYGKYLKELVKKEGLEKRIKFLGIKTGKDALKEYQNSDIFVLPSISSHNNWVEGGGVVNLEAQLCGIPVVASNCGGIPEYVKNKETGLLTQENPEDLAKKIEILIKDKKLRETMGEIGRKFVLSKYSKDNLKNLTKLYKSL